MERSSLKGALPTGLLLSGGLSRRMGSDKGLLLRDGVPWFLHLFRLLESRLPVVRLSLREEQIPTYSRWISRECMAVDNPDVNAEGPLRGLLSAHALYPGESLLVLPCDLQLIHPATIDRMLEMYAETGESLAVHLSGGWEPLCALYTSSFLSGVSGASKNDRNFSIRHWIETLGAAQLKLERSEEEQFRNCNTPEEKIFQR